MNLVSSSTAVLASAVLTIAGFASAQTQQHASGNQSLNFYVTTPQTGESVVVGEGSQTPSAAAVQTASANPRAAHTSARQQTASRSSRSTRQASTRSRSTSSQSPQYGITQVSNSPANAYLSSRSAAAANSGSTVATSAQAANFYTVTHPSAPAGTQTQLNPAYVSNATAPEQKRGLFNRILHPRQKSQAAAPAQQSAWSNIKPSALAGKVQQGMASWYGSDWHGRKTASGERYNMNTMTAAHRSLPFGTLVKVRNERNGRECIVRINNRGPFTRGRILDLSKAAASALGMVNSGVAKVKCEVIGRS